MDNKVKEYIDNSVLFLGMAGTGKSEILKEAQHIASKNEAVKKNHYCLSYT